MRFINPECVQEKCHNCDGVAYDAENDAYVECEHGCHTFERIMEMEDSGN